MNKVSVSPSPRRYRTIFVHPPHDPVSPHPLPATLPAAMATAAAPTSPPAASPPPPPAAAAAAVPLREHLASVTAEPHLASVLTAIAAAVEEVAAAVRTGLTRKCATFNAFGDEQVRLSRGEPVGRARGGGGGGRWEGRERQRWRVGGVEDGRLVAPGWCGDDPRRLATTRHAATGCFPAIMGSDSSVRPCD